MKPFSKTSKPASFSLKAISGTSTVTSPNEMLTSMPSPLKLMISVESSKLCFLVVKNEYSNLYSMFSVKPALKKVSKYDNKFKKAGAAASQGDKQDFRASLKVVKKNVMEEIMNVAVRYLLKEVKLVFLEEGG